MTRRAARGAAAILALAVAGSSATSVRAADADLEKRVDAIVADLGEPDASIRARGAKALKQLGPAAVPLLIDRIPDDVSSKRFQGVVDGIGGLDADGAVAAIETCRSEWRAKGWRRAATEKPAPKEKDPEPGRGRGRPRDTAPPDAPRGQRWIDAVLDRLRTHRADSVRRTVTLEPGALWDASFIPPWIEQLLASPVKKLPESLVGESIAVRESAMKLEIDTGKDGKFAAAVGIDFGRVIDVGPKKTPRKVLVFQRLGRWIAAPATTLSGEVDGVAVEFLDADQDGAFDGEKDLVRFAGGAFRHVGEEPTAWTEQGLVSWKLIRFTTRDEGKDTVIWTLQVETEPEPSWRTPEQAAEMKSLNTWRQAAGLPPQRIDRMWSEACGLHHAYWVANGFSGHDEYKGKPAITPRGAEAGKRSSVGTSPDGARFARDIFWTILHRGSCLGTPEGGVGAFPGPVGSLLWGPPIDASQRGFPLLIPGPGQTGVPVKCEPEIPVPDPDPKYYDTPRGTPICITWTRAGDRFADLKDLSVELFRATPKAVDPADEGESVPTAAGPVPISGTLWCKEHRYKEDFASGFPEDSAIFCASSPLDADTAYVVRFRATGKEGPVEFAWQFRTE
ncbi:MAG: hypothetical protein K8T90_04965 [Planctomycetes bacterium]|nr:hypothetical protein [Planctomycetota bacterium]